MFQIAPGLIAVIVTTFAILLALAIVYGRRAHRQRVLAGREELIGRTAIVQTDMEPRGTVFIEGESWAAISEAGRIEPGEEVIVTKVDGLKLWVTKKG